MKHTATDSDRILVVNRSAMGRIVVLTGLIVLGLWWPAAQTLLGQERANSSSKATSSEAKDARLADARQRYAFDSWPEGKVYDGVDLGRLQFAGYVGEPIDFVGEPLFIQRFRDRSHIPRFLVELAVNKTVHQAHQRLLGYLAYVSSLRPVPTAASQDLTVGEIGFVGPARADRISWIAFVRGNVTVRLCCLDPRRDPPPDMRSLARSVDSLVAGQTVVAAGGQPSKPIVSLASARRRCRAGEVIDLDLSPRGAVTALHWVVGGPGQGYVERNAQGRWQLHTTGAGPITLRVDVLGTNGVVSSRRVALQVEPE